MSKTSRRSLMKVGGALAVGAALGNAAVGEEQAASKMSTLEGDLKIHPKFLYRYYLVLLGTGQICALYGADRDREEQLARLKLPIGIKVRGVPGSKYHNGGTKENLSPFPAGWTIYMDVHEIETLKIDFGSGTPSGSTP